MTNANYDRFLKLLGKLCYTFDNAGGLITAQQLSQYRTMEQFAKSDQETIDLPEVGILAANFASWTNAISNGPTALQNIMESIATRILTSSDFTDALTTVPVSLKLADIVTAWNTDFGLNTKTLSTLTTSGLVNFLFQVSGVTITHTSGSPSYPDGTYVVNTIV